MSNASAIIAFPPSVPIRSRAPNADAANSATRGVPTPPNRTDRSVPGNTRPEPRAGNPSPAH